MVPVSNLVYLLQTIKNLHLHLVIQFQQIDNVRNKQENRPFKGKQTF